MTPRWPTGIPVVLGAAILAACGAVQLPFDRPNLAEREFFPLEPGTLWVYQIEDASGRIALQKTRVRGPLYLEDRDLLATVVEETGGLSGDLMLDVDRHPVLYFQRGSFLYRFSGVGYDGTFSPEPPFGRAVEKVLPSDPLRHPEWESRMRLFSVSAEDRFEVRARSRAKRSDEPLRVGNWTFRDCLEVDTWLATTRTVGDRAPILFHYTDWYAPGVGLVKSVVRVAGEPGPQTTIELVSFRKGAGAR